jgi:UDP-N-acetyl-D-glucosamine dehydrogenase
MRAHRSTQTVGVVGLGYVGLPLATAFAEAGLNVVGVEADPVKIAALNAQDSYVEDVPADRLVPLLSSGQLQITDDYAVLREAEAIVICLPTPLNEHREPDLTILVSGMESVAENLQDGVLVVLESTTFPGTTREVLLPILEQTGRRLGRDFYLAFAPERVDPGNRRYTIRNTPRVVGGMSPECTERAERLYSTVAEEVYPVSDPESAEMAKLLENIFRGVNIALVNELAILCDRMGIDVWEVIEAASTKPFGFMPFYPGPGLGGHCIPVDPFYLTWRARSFDMATEFIELAARINVNMPYHVVARISNALNAEKKPLNGSRILLLGVSYKPNVDDTRESPALMILDLLRQSGANVAYHDPHVPELSEAKLSSTELSPFELRRTDCAVIVTDHNAIELSEVIEIVPKVIDLRNTVRRKFGTLPETVEVL